MRIREDRHGSTARPKIRQEDIEGGNAVVITITDVEEEKVKGDDGDKILVVLITKEFGEKVHRLNKTQLGYMVNRLGEETDKWIGERVPLVKTEQPFGPPGKEKYFDTVWVAAPEMWDGLLNIRTRERKATVGKVTRRKRGK